MADIHPKGIYGGNQYGTTMHNSDSLIKFPKREGAENAYGTRTKVAKPEGGTQFGTTQQNSKPAPMPYPNANVALMQGKVTQKGSAVSVDSEKVLKSTTGPGMNIKSQNTRDSGNTSGLGCQPAVRYAKKGQKGNSTPKVF